MQFAQTGPRSGSAFKVSDLNGSVGHCRKIDGSTGCNDEQNDKKYNFIADFLKKIFSFSETL